MARIAMLVEDSFEDSEFRVPYDRLTQAGHDVTVVGAQQGKEVHGKRGNEHVRIEATPDQLDPHDLDALVIPGGFAPDRLRVNEMIVQFVKDMGTHGKTMAAVCHGPSLLIEADLVEGKHLTSAQNIKTDLKNAGAVWEDREVVVDGKTITSRKPKDLEAFSKAILDRL